MPSHDRVAVVDDHDRGDRAADSASSEPIERSISAVIITTVSPAAMIPMFADLQEDVPDVRLR